MLSQLQTQFENHSTLRQLGLALLAVGLGAFGGLVLVAGNPVVPFVAVLALVLLPWFVTRPVADVLLVVFTVMVLPFAVLPVHLAVLTPTLLEVGLLLLYIAWLLRSLLASGEGIQRTPLDLALIVFLAATLFAFVLGLGHDASTDVIHNYFKLLLSIGVFFAAVNVLRNWQEVALVLKAIMLLGALEAFAGVVLWRLPDTFAGSLLTRLSVVGYPTDRVIRYVEDNPALGERAVGTQVDPNSFGGLLVIIAVLTAVQLLARKPLLPRWLLTTMVVVDIATLVLTQSRSAFIGLLVAGVLVATMRYRRLWGWFAAGGVLALVVGTGSGYLARLFIGFRFEDQASLMRLAEYRNALDIIGRYPAFGVGFGTAGELDLTTGVSSIYLTIAERAGLLGLGLFLVVVVVFFANTLPAIVHSFRRAPARGAEGEFEWSALDSTLLGATAAIMGVLAVGLVDHYYFNIEFPHMAALFWLTIALALVARKMLLPPVAKPS